MRISDWSSDVCSSDLSAHPWPQQVIDARRHPVHGAQLACIHHEAVWRAIRRRGPAIGFILRPARLRHRVGVDPVSQRRRHDLRLPRVDRSEEHTSELQSLMRISYAVFCLKKNKQPHKLHTESTTMYS